MSSNFLTWAQGQRDRQDPVGDFCRDFMADPKRLVLGGREEILDYLQDRGVEDAVIDAFQLAWTEFEYRGGIA